MISAGSRLWRLSTLSYTSGNDSRMHSPARSISRFLFPPKRATTIPLGLPLLTGSSDLPGSVNGAGHSSSPIWSCFAWGLPCQSDCSDRGALLPHLFTLTPDRRTDRSGMFSVALAVAVRLNARPRPLAGMPPYEDRTFLPTCPTSEHIQRLPDRAG
jgi:hypothetical protein